MNRDNGFIKIYRSFTDWEWFTDVNTAHLWTYLLCRAQWEATRWRGIEIRRGQLLESLPALASHTGLSVRSVRTALKHLKSTGEVTDEVTGFGRLITVVKYDEYQSLAVQHDRLSDRQSDREVTGKRQGSDREVTAYKESKKNKESKNNKEEKERGASAPAPSLEEVRSFVLEEKLSIDPDRFYHFYSGQGWKTSSGVPIGDWKSKARAWQSTERKKQKEPLPPYYDPNPIRNKNVVPASREEVEWAKAMLNGTIKKGEDL